MFIVNCETIISTFDTLEKLSWSWNVLAIQHFCFIPTYSYNWLSVYNLLYSLCACTWYGPRIIIALLSVEFYHCDVTYYAGEMRDCGSLWLSSYTNPISVFKCIRSQVDMLEWPSQTRNKVNLLFLKSVHTMKEWWATNHLPKSNQSKWPK